MEHRPGETSADRLQKGPIALEQLVGIGAEIGDGLHCAYRNGVVHRDLKPGNFMLTKGGAMILDFGLAKSGKTPNSSVALTATISTPAAMRSLTAEGTLLGTFQYMSLEQVDGKEAEASCDIFSFGAVLYEMATGKRGFGGKSQISLASATLEKEPTAITSFLPTAPPALDDVSRGCLLKDSQAG